MHIIIYFMSIKTGFCVNPFVHSNMYIVCRTSAYNPPRDSTMWTLYNIFSVFKSYTQNYATPLSQNPLLNRHKH